jgi:hypothetical protein
MTNQTEKNTLTFYRIKNDVNGNPRYVVHYFDLLTQEELDKDLSLNFSKYDNWARPRGRTIGGKKYHNNSFGGGIVFQSYSLSDLMQSINELTGREYTDYTIERV